MEPNEPGVEDIKIFYCPEKGGVLSKPKAVLLGFIRTRELAKDLVNEVVTILNRHASAEAVERFPSKSGEKKIYVRYGYESRGGCGGTDYASYIVIAPRKLPNVTPKSINQILLVDMKGYHSRS